MEKIKVFIVDDHQMFREGLKFMLNKKAQYEVIGEAVDGKDFLNKIKNLKPDIVLMDISMPNMNGIEATKLFLEEQPNVPVLALSMFGEEEYYYKMIHAGVRGFILKESGSNDLENGIKEAMEGGNFFSNELLRNVAPKIGKLEESNKFDLSPEEKNILQELCAGLTSLEISKRLKIAQVNVDMTISNLIEIAEVARPVDLIMYAIKNKIVEV